MLCESLLRLIAGADGLASAGSWTSFLTAAADWNVTRPDAAIVDPSLLGDDPVEALRALSAGSDVPVLLFSRSVSADYVHLLVVAGAGGVIGTGATGATLLGATRAVAGMQRYIPSELRIELMQRMLASERPAYLVLSPREREVVRRAASGNSVAAIARVLVVSESTVKTHLRAAYEKLGVHDRASAALALMRIGMLGGGEGAAQPAVPALSARRRSPQRSSPGRIGVPTLELP
ncbi:MAG TPA: response regulator transcription factor [Solirubrobacteraceae bacterium]